MNFIRYGNKVLRRFKNLIEFYGFNFHCSVCNTSFRKMKPLDESWYLRGELLDHYTENAICPRCGSWIRHRFMMELLKQKSLIRDGFKILHFAPEGYFVKNIMDRYRNIDYVTCDINPENYSSHDAIKIDITKIELSDNQFDLVICSHVLEHIDDDVSAINELYRILKENGQVLIAVPIYGKETYEDPDLDFSQREKMYGIGDHKRLYGLDLSNKLKMAGFSVQIYSLEDINGKYFDDTVNSPHIESDRYLFLCRK